MREGLEQQRLDAIQHAWSAALSVPGVLSLGLSKRAYETLVRLCEEDPESVEMLAVRSWETDSPVSYLNAALLAISESVVPAQLHPKVAAALEGTE